MHQWSLSELQGVSSTQRGASTPRTARDGASVQATAPSSRPRRGSSRRCLCPTRGAPLWALLLLVALVVPGAWSFLSEDQEELLVELHNHYRGQVSPSAAAMLPLKWDSSLKVIAEGYAAKCIWNHNPELEDTGENLFAGTGSLNLTVAMEKWFLEHLDYDYQNNSCDEDKMCGHYTQMVWADTHRVGCAFHVCNSMEGLEGERFTFLVCNYFPAGNYDEEWPYVEGDSCSSCPENLQNCENKLCVADTEEEEDGDDEDEDEDEEMTVFPPLAKSDPSPSSEGEEVDVVPPSPTSDSFLQPVITPSSQDSEDFPQPASSAPSTHHPKILLTKQEEEEEEEEVVDETKEETTDKNEGERKKDVARKPNRNIETSGGSVSSPSLLLVCLTGMLTLRL